jgi:hypothetical protein
MFENKNKINKQIEDKIEELVDSSKDELIKYFEEKSKDIKTNTSITKDDAFELLKSYFDNLVAKGNGKDLFASKLSIKMLQSPKYIDFARLLKMADGIKHPEYHKIAGFNISIRLRLLSVKEEMELENKYFKYAKDNPDELGVIVNWKMIIEKLHIANTISPYLPESAQFTIDELWDLDTVSLDNLRECYQRMETERSIDNNDSKVQEDVDVFIAELLNGSDDSEKKYQFLRTCSRQHLMELSIQLLAELKRVQVITKHIE